jgi:hypothetical protein
MAVVVVVCGDETYAYFLYERQAQVKAKLCSLPKESICQGMTQQQNIQYNYTD